VLRSRDEKFGGIATNQGNLKVLSTELRNRYSSCTVRLAWRCSSSSGWKVQFVGCRPISKMSSPSKSVPEHSESFRDPQVLNLFRCRSSEMGLQCSCVAHIKLMNTLPIVMSGLLSPFLTRTSPSSDADDIWWVGDEEGSKRIHQCLHVMENGAGKGTRVS
jgi:hypothetical protein